jgi:non-specific protein-tyrosine kinase
MTDFIDLQRLIGIILRRGWLLVVVTALGAMLGYMISQRQTPVYEATTTVLVGQIFRSANIDRQEILTSELVAQTYSDLTRRQPVLQAVVDTLKLRQSWQQLRSRVSVELVEGTQLIQITVEAGSSLTAQVIADEVARQMILFSPTESNADENKEVRVFVQQQLENLQARIESGQNRLNLLESFLARAGSVDRLIELQAEISSLESLITNWENTYIQLLGFLQTGQSPNTLTIIEPAQANPKPVSPQVQFIVFFGGALGAFLALGLIFLLEYLEDTYRTPEEITREFGLPVLGSIRDKGRSWDNSVGVYITKHPRSPIAEAYRLLRANLELISTDQPLKTILITSCDKGVGKSSVSTNLAITMAQSDQEIILLDANLRNSSIHNLMGLQNELGLSDILSKDMKISEALRTDNGVKGGVITGGASPSNPSELLGSKKMDQILAELKEISDVVIIDAPPLIVSDAVVLSAKVDGVLLVIRLGNTRKKQVKKTMQQLNRAEVRVIGVVLTGVTDRGVEYYGADLNSSDEVIEADGRLPAVRRNWSVMLEKLGSITFEVSNGKYGLREAGKLHRAQVRDSNGQKPEEIANAGEFCPDEDCMDNGKLQSETHKKIVKSGKSKKVSNATNA